MQKVIEKLLELLGLRRPVYAPVHIPVPVRRYRR